MNEFEFIKALQAIPSNVAGGFGIGDDTALVGEILVTKDILVEDIHFGGEAPVKQIFNKLFTSNISDIASMGGRSIYALLGLATPKGRLDLDHAVTAIAESCKRYSVSLIGGDTSSSVNDIFLSLTVIGKKGVNVLKRDGAMPGDYVVLSRPTGMCRLSVEKELGTHNHDIDPLYHYNLRAEDKLGLYLGGMTGITSCIDISDGIGKDGSRISDASRMQLVLNAEKIPVEHLEPFNVDSLDYAVTSGEEYALLFTVDGERAKKVIPAIERSQNRAMHVIGRVEGGRGVTVKMKDGSKKDITNAGFDHNL